MTVRSRGEHYHKLRLPEVSRFVKHEDDTIPRLRRELCYNCVNQPGCILSPRTSSGEQCPYFLRRNSK